VVTTSGDLVAHQFAEGCCRARAGGVRRAGASAGPYVHQTHAFGGLVRSPSRSVRQACAFSEPVRSPGRYLHQAHAFGGLVRSPSRSVHPAGPFT
jgi:hypothetical protein